MRVYVEPAGSDVVTVELQAAVTCPLPACLPAYSGAGETTLDTQARTHSAGWQDGGCLGES